jgi:exopolysaccharide biosynthesis WecB/TagA/CpsF family protein
MSRIPFLGLDFDALGPAEAVPQIVARARKLLPFTYVATPNVDHMVRLETDPTCRPLYRDAWLTLCDSRILELLASFSGIRLPACPGADIVETLFSDHVDPDQPVVIIGGDIELMRRLRVDFALADLRWFDAPANLRTDAAAREQCVRFILQNPAPFIFLAVGSPQQEMIASEVARRGGAVGVAICCGASLEFLTGKVHRAPKWMRNARLEWLHRLVSEPGRLWRRYLVDGPRIFSIWRRWRLATR